MDKVREEFEDWYRSHMLNNEGEHFAVIESTIESYKHDRDKYGYSDIQEMWLAWKASRESIVVNLPLSITNWWYEEVCEALDKVGVRYE